MLDMLSMRSYTCLPHSHICCLDWGLTMTCTARSSHECSVSWPDLPQALQRAKGNRAKGGGGRGVVGLQQAKESNDSPCVCLTLSQQAVASRQCRTITLRSV